MNFTKLLTLLSSQSIIRSIAMASATKFYCKKCGFGTDLVDRKCSERSPPEDHDMVEINPPAQGNNHLR